ncbi:MAG: TlyA family RNA methyltransferase [Chloroflexota bacterium]
MKKRLDVLLVEKGLAESRSQAQRLIMAGQVRVGNAIALKPGQMVDSDWDIGIIQPARFVSRGGEKLEAALVEFGLTNLESTVCVDVGASTGGFTDCLLQHGAKRVYAVDVGYGVLHWRLRRDERVVVMERTNARYLKGFEENIDLVTIDASFISLKILLPVIRRWFRGEKGNVIALIKPQFEAGQQEAARGEGVIRDGRIHRQILEEMIRFCQQEGWVVRGLMRSPLIGPKGNVEFLIWLSLSGTGLENTDVVIEHITKSPNQSLKISDI